MTAGTRESPKVKKASARAHIVTVPIKRRSGEAVTVPGQTSGTLSNGLAFTAHFTIAHQAS